MSGSGIRLCMTVFRCKRCVSCKTPLGLLLWSLVSTVITTQLTSAFKRLCPVQFTKVVTQESCLSYYEIDLLMCRNNCLLIVRPVSAFSITPVQSINSHSHIISQHADKQIQCSRVSINPQSRRASPAANRAPIDGSPTHTDYGCVYCPHASAHYPFLMRSTGARDHTLCT